MSIKTPTKPLQGAGEGIRRLAAVVLRGDRGPNADVRQGDSASSQPLELYVGVVSQSLAVFRFVSFAMGAGLVFVLNLSDNQLLVSGEQELMVLGPMVLLVGTFNVYRIVWRFDPARPRDMLQRTSLAIDMVLSVSLTLMSGGLNSPFLIYSISPILTASLLMNLQAAILVAGVSAFVITGIHVVAEFGIFNLPGFLERNYLLLLALLYTAVSMLVVGLPFLANLNWQRRVRFESLAAERQRLRREVHDNVAQTLAFLNLKMKLAEQRASRGRSAITQRDLAEIGSVVERTYLAVRDYLDDTGEESEDPLGFQIRAVVDQWSRDTGLPVETMVTGDEEVLPAPVKFQLLQVTREALANVAKHAYSKNVWVELWCGPDDVTIRVRDDGRGFEASGLKGHGMGIMSERTAMAGASLDISSTPGEGTEVAVTYSRVPKQGD